jgi:hypothetical protein
MRASGLTEILKAKVYGINSIQDKERRMIENYYSRISGEQLLQITWLVATQFDKCQDTLTFRSILDASSAAFLPDNSMPPKMAPILGGQKQH